MNNKLLYLWINNAREQAKESSILTEESIIWVNKMLDDLERCME